VGPVTDPDRTLEQIRSVLDAVYRAKLNVRPVTCRFTLDHPRESSRIVRRVVLGDSARNDHELTDLLARLRGKANWSLLHPTRSDLREEFLQRLRVQLHRAEPGSLSGPPTIRPRSAGSPSSWTCCARPTCVCGTLPPACAWMSREAAVPREQE
jgi:hypothetical protein